MSKNLKIGIPGYKTNESYGVASTYLEFAAKFGIPVIIMPHEEKADIDVLLLPGGPDAAPSSFGAFPGFKTDAPDVFRQYFFEHRLKNYIESTPIIGICLGAQQLAVYFGSHLTQNLIFHPHSKDRGLEGHKVTLLDENEEVIKIDTEVKNKDKTVTIRKMPLKMPVNSHHHQGILVGDLAPCLRPVAIYDEEPDEMVIEAFVHRTLPIISVQWHPEEWYDKLSMHLIQENIIKPLTNNEETESETSKNTTVKA